MRVALVSSHASPLAAPGYGDAGGMNVYVRELARALTRLGARIDVFGPGAEAERACARYDVVHSHYWKSGPAGRALAKRCGAPLVHTHHTLARVKNRFLPPGDPPERDERATTEDEVLEAADAVVASTWREQDELGDRARVVVVPPGVDRRLFKPGPKPPRRRPIVLVAARIQPLKGLDLALRALALLDRPPLLLVAGGPSGPRGEEELRRLQRLARTPVRFLGAQPQAHLALLYREADAVLVSSHSESFGLVALEALASGTPVVGTAAGGLPALVCEHVSGFVVAERDPAVFADRVERVLAGACQGAWEAAAPFSWEQTARSLLALYVQLTRRRTSGASSRARQAEDPPRHGVTSGETHRWR